MKKESTYFNEQIRHFSCGKCEKWWSIGDAPDNRDDWFCPWCGKKQDFDKDSESPE